MDFQPLYWWVFNNANQWEITRRICAQNGEYPKNIHEFQCPKYCTFNANKALRIKIHVSCWSLRSFCDKNMIVTVFTGGLDGHQHLSFRLVLHLLQHPEPIFLHALSNRGEYRELCTKWKQSVQRIDVRFNVMQHNCPTTDILSCMTVRLFCKKGLTLVNFTVVAGHVGISFNFTSQDNCEGS